MLSVGEKASGGAHLAGWGLQVGGVQHRGQAPREPRPATAFPVVSMHTCAPALWAQSSMAPSLGKDGQKFAPLPREAAPQYQGWVAE